jgi:tetratricopeptide (TPR) repeat protein
VSFSERALKQHFFLPLPGILVLLAACQPESARQEKALRRQIAHELQNHSYVSAAPLARQLVQRAPQDERAWKYLLQAEVGLHDLEGARQSLGEWRKTVKSPSLKAEDYEGDIAREGHQFAAALTAWQKVIQSQPKNRRVREKIALLQQSQNHWSEADSTWSEALQMKDSATARINRAVCRRRLHRWPEAFDDLHRAQQLNPDDPDVRRWSRLFAGLGKFLDQIGEFDAKLAVLPEDVGLLSDRALLFLRSDDPELALDDAEKAARIAPWAMRPTLFRAIALIALHRARECESLSVREPLRLEYLSSEFLENLSRLDSAISVERANPEHFISRSWQLNEIGQPQLALQDAETAVRLDAKSAAALTELSYALSKLGRTEEAFERIKQATDLDSSSASAWQYRGELEMVRGNYLAAVDSLSRALGIHQTIASLQKREECYRHLGLQMRADEDRRAVEKLTASAPH